MEEVDKMIYTKQIIAPTCVGFAGVGEQLSYFIKCILTSLIASEALAIVVPNLWTFVDVILKFNKSRMRSNSNVRDDQ